ncbi:hypothetical protein P280DRAFT_507855 [Massarina eburnea CBS 473.64]|uniref:Sister chromatid separation protein-like protein n=1 Tax=Massarina eburnea CBS 473.64 TaxID=1395130 RepID=A0A6A6RYB5_9PLEO|nr:hypothetical protein P280DRAFT_507855 [Massarina eburnea CBS 473.64]
MADARGEYWYFDPDVDAGKITVPELRSILLKHGVHYPASAKKAVLVDLFTAQVLPQAAQLQRSFARTKRSTRGIVDVPSSASTTDDANDEETLIAPEPVRRPRRTTRIATEDREERPAPVRRSKTPSRTVPTKHARETEPDLDEQPAVRRTRKSSIAPPVERSAPDPESWHRHDAASPFTQENPFQSGSSPALTEARDRRRRTTMGMEIKEKRKSDMNRRRTVQPNVEQHDRGIVVPTRKTFDMPHRRTVKEEAYEVPDSVDMGEEFAPEEQLELVRERAKNGDVDILPPRRGKRSSEAAKTAKVFSATLFFLVFSVFGGLWRQEKYSTGFCGVGQDSTSLGGVEIPDFALDLLPTCEPCPPHAFCYKNLVVKCEKDFVKKEHPLSLNGLIPLPPTCEADNEKTRRVNTVADRAVHLLRERKAQYECKEPNAEGKIPESPEVSMAELKHGIASMKRKSLSDQAFDDLFVEAIGETARREEVVESGEGSERRLASTSLAELSLPCSIRRSLRETLERHLFTIAMIIIAVASGSYGKYSFTRNRTLEARAKQLASDVFDRLANQAALAHEAPGTFKEPGLSMNQLRDDVLRNEFSAGRRISLWQRVQKKVEHNSNIRAAVREGQSGDITRMWEWIGPVQLIEEGRAPGRRSGRRSSGRQSLGWTGGSSPPEFKEKKESRHWDEGHPVY